MSAPIRFYFGASNSKSDSMEERTKRILGEFFLGLDAKKEISYRWWDPETRELLIQATKIADKYPTQDNITLLNTLRGKVGKEEFLAVRDSHIVVLFFDDDTVEKQRGTQMEFSFALCSNTVREIYVVASDYAWKVLSPITFYHIDDPRIIRVQDEEDLIKKFNDGNKFIVS